MWRAIRVAAVAALLLKIVPASADAILEVPLEAGQFTSVTYTGPNNALFTAIFDAVGEIGGAPVFIPDGEVWSWTALGPFGLGDCGRDSPGSCGNFPVNFIGTINDSMLMFTMSISGSCTEGINFAPCPGFSLSPLGFLDIDVSGANAGDLFLTATPLPAALPLFATGIGVVGLFGWRRRRHLRPELSVTEQASPH